MSRFFTKIWTYRISGTNTMTLSTSAEKSKFLNKYQIFLQDFHENFRKYQTTGWYRSLKTFTAVRYRDSAFKRPMFVWLSVGSRFCDVICAQPEIAWHNLLPEEALDNIDLNQMSHRYAAASYKMNPPTSHLIDRCENVNLSLKKKGSIFDINSLYY